MTDITQRLRESAKAARALDRAALLEEAAKEIERLRQHRCLWGNDPSGPYYSDEYLSAIDNAPANKVRGLWFPPATQPPPPAPPAPPPESK